MIDRKRDITKKVISSGNINRRIGRIFPDSVILDTRFNVVSISENILDATGYSRSDLVSQSVSLLARSYNIKAVLEQKLLSGYFEEEQFEISKKDSGTITYCVSGFYMGIVTDVNGLIILKCKNLNSVITTENDSDTKTAELDQFVYLSAHNLRGPLATIKGLINLTKLSSDLEEIKQLIQHMDSYAEKLDDNLHRLIYFAESDKVYESSNQQMCLKSICQELQTTVREGTIDTPVLFEYNIQNEPCQLNSGDIILSMLRNVVLFFCQQNKLPDSHILLDTHSNHHTTELIIRANGFTIADSVKEKLTGTSFGYSEILNYRELINCYAAKKIMFKLRGDIQFVPTSEDELIVLMTIPRDQRCGGS